MEQLREIVTRGRGKCLINTRGLTTNVTGQQTSLLCIIRLTESAIGTTSFSANAIDMRFAPSHAVYRLFYITVHSYDYQRRVEKWIRQQDNSTSPKKTFFREIVLNAGFLQCHHS